MDSPNVTMLYWTSADWSIFSVLPSYPYSLLSSLEMKVASQDGNICHVSTFTGSELYLWEKIVGQRDEKGCTFHLMFPWYVRTQVRLTLQPKKSFLQEGQKLYQDYLHSFLNYIPDDIINSILEYQVYDVNSLFPTVIPLGTSQKEVCYSKQSILLPMGSTQMRKQNVPDELNYVWHVSWAYVRRSDPFTILLPKDQHSIEAELSRGGEVKFLQKMDKGIYHALMIPQEELCKYQQQHRVIPIPGRKGVKKIHVRFEPDHPKDTQVILIKHVVAHIIRKNTHFLTSTDNDSSSEEE